jgi:excisionase family DNA binding protein
MAQAFYTLEEAAQVLGVAAEELNQMAQRREIRAFADRGTWRFRSQDVEELARRRGKGSNPDLQLGEGGAAKPPATGTPDDSSVFTFSLGSEDEEVKLGEEKTREGPSSVHGPGSGSGKTGPKSPSPKPGSDSDVRLVSEGSDVNFKIASDSAIKTVSEGGSGSGRKKGGKSDSDVKIVPDQGPGDSVVPIGGPPAKSGTDSDIRLEPDSAHSHPASHDDSMLTEEIDLDAELKEAEESSLGKSKSRKSKPKIPAAPAADVTSPFELSDSDLEGGPTPTKPLPKQGGKPAAKKRTPESSDIELTPAAGDDSSPISLSDELPTLSPKDEEVGLGDQPAKPVGAAGDSGIGLEAPADSGISLEKKEGDSSEEVEFELSLDAESTPKPKPAAPVVEDDSSSEFELTLDDSGGLAPLEEEAAPAGGSGSGEKDIFETDFDVPALEDESGSQAVALEDSDTDLESSDFDLALGDEDAGSEDESGSQVVVLEDEEEADEGAATVARSARRRAPAAAADLDESGEVAVEELPEEEEDEGIPVRRAPAASADWGILPAAVMIPCVIVMFLVGIMGFEVLHGMWGYRQPGKVSGVIVRAFADMFGAEMPKD